MHAAAADILVLVDDGEMRNALVATLEDGGYRVAVCRSGEGALEEIRQRPPDILVTDPGLLHAGDRNPLETLKEIKPEAAEAPNVILLDLHMPKLSGLDVLRALKADDGTRAIPVLVCTNSSRDQDLQEAIRLGAAGYVVKSDVSLHELCDRVAALLEG